MPPVNVVVWLVENVRGSLKYDIPIIALSGQGSRADAAKAMKAGATDFVDKESAPEELRVAVIRAHNSEKAEEVARDATVRGRAVSV